MEKLSLILSWSGNISLPSVSDYDIIMIVYSLILFKAFKWYYKMAGLLMTLWIVIGYIAAICGIILTSDSKCTDSDTSMVHTIAMINIFSTIGFATLTFVLAHLFLICAGCGGKTGKSKIATMERE